MLLASQRKPAMENWVRSLVVPAHLSSGLFWWPYDMNHWALCFLLSAQRSLEPGEAEADPSCLLCVSENLSCSLSGFQFLHPKREMETLCPIELCYKDRVKHFSFTKELWQRKLDPDHFLLSPSGKQEKTDSFSDQLPWNSEGTLSLVKQVHPSVSSCHPQHRDRSSFFHQIIHQHFPHRQGILGTSSL